MLTLFSGCPFPVVRCLGSLDLCLIAREATRDSWLYSSTKEPCTKTPFEGTCRGTVTFGAMEIEDGKEPPLFLVARNQASLNGPEAFFNFSKEINVSGQQYQLGMLSLS